MNRPPEPYLSNNAQAQRLAKDYLRFILQNISALRRFDRLGKKEKAAREFTALLEKGEDLTGPSLTYVDGIYEDTMKGLGLPSVERVSKWRRLK